MRALIYARISTAQQTDGASLDSQIAECRAFALGLGYTVEKEVQEVFSGSYLFDRPLLNDCRNDIRNGLYDALIVYDVDRLSRNLPHLGILLDECIRFNTKLVFVKNDFEHSPEGLLLFSIRGYLAEAERLKIIERTTRGRRTKAQQGTLSFKRKLYGYVLDEEGKRKIFEPEAEVVRFVFERYLKGDSLRDIADGLNKQGTPAPNSKMWWYNTLSRMITNPCYSGRTIIFRQKKEYRFVKGERRSYDTFNDESEHIELPDVTPAIVSPEIFNQAQALIKRNAKEKRAKPQKEFLFRGMIYCQCGYRMTPQTSHKTFRYYSCNSKNHKTIACQTKILKAQKSEEEIWDEVIKMLKRPGETERKIKRHQLKRAKNPQNQVKALHKQIEKLEKDIRTLASRVDELTETAWRVVKGKLETKESELGRLRDSLKKAMETAQEFPVIQDGAIKSLALQILPNLDELTFEDRVNTLLTLEAELIWDGETLELKIGDRQYYRNGYFDSSYKNTVNFSKIPVFSTTF